MGLTDIDVLVVRDGKAIGMGVLEQAFKNSVKAIKSRGRRSVIRVAPPIVLIPVIFN